MKYRFLFLCAAIIFSNPVLAAGPDIPLKDFAGKTRNVNEYVGQGKWTVITVWAHDCHICNQEIHHMVFFHDAHKNKDAVVLGVTVDGWTKRKLAKGFMEEHGLNFVNLIAEPEQSVLMKFGGGPFFGTPTYYVYAPDGELMAKNVGPVAQEDIEKFIAENEVPTSPESRK
ncbi:MAG: TlpA family protein disulfide reductase [Gammaproteobacteria bacterium]|nr:TlpA family protein disulfide reductase [Gammaproteobacteria bacterium]